MHRISLLFAQRSATPEGITQRIHRKYDKRQILVQKKKCSSMSRRSENIISVYTAGVTSDL